MKNLSLAEIVSAVEAANNNIPLTSTQLDIVWEGYCSEPRIPLLEKIEREADKQDMECWYALQEVQQASTKVIYAALDQWVEWYCEYLDGELALVPSPIIPDGKIAVTSIKFGFSENSLVPRNKVVTSFDAANKILSLASIKAPQGGGYDKTDFVVTWADGETYAGTFDLKHFTHGSPNLAAHIAGNIKFHTCDERPGWFSEKEWAIVLQQNSPESRQECRDFLAKYDLNAEVVETFTRDLAEERETYRVIVENYLSRRMLMAAGAQKFVRLDGNTQRRGGAEFVIKISNNQTHKVIIELMYDDTLTVQLWHIPNVKPAKMLEEVSDLHAPELNNVIDRLSLKRGK